MALKALVGKPAAPITGTVTAVDVAACSCDVEPNDGGAPVLGARLRAVLDGSDAGVLLVPKVGADVLLLPLDDYTFAVALASELTEARITIGGSTWVLDASAITMNGGNQGGLVLVTPLVTLLNLMITQINTLGTLMGSHVHQVLPSPTGIAAIPSGLVVPPLPSTSTSILANPVITQ